MALFSLANDQLHDRIIHNNGIATMYLFPTVTKASDYGIINFPQI